MFTSKSGLLRNSQWPASDRRHRHRKSGIEHQLWVRELWIGQSGVDRQHIFVTGIHLKILPLTFLTNQRIAEKMLQILIWCQKNNYTFPSENCHLPHTFKNLMPHFCHKIMFLWRKCKITYPSQICAEHIFITKLCVCVKTNCHICAFFLHENVILYFNQKVIILWWKCVRCLFALEMWFCISTTKT